MTTLISQRALCHRDFDPKAIKLYIMSTVNIKHVKYLNNDWLRGLEFYKQEITILKKRLEEIAGDNTGQEASEQIEHFQNQLIIYREHFDELKHLIHINNLDIEKQLVKTEPFVESSTVDEHNKLTEGYLTEEKMFNQMRHEFNRFAAKWM